MKNPEFSIYNGLYIVDTISKRKIRNMKKYRDRIDQPVYIADRYTGKIRDL